MATQDQQAASGVANKTRLDKALDAALDETFPASDPTAVGNTEQTAPSGRDVDRAPAHIDEALVDRLAKQVKAGSR